MKSRLKKTVSLILAFIMLMSCVTAFAENGQTGTEYKIYTALGDSIPAGYGPYNDAIKGFARIDVAYPAVLADSLGAELLPMARTGFRSLEVRYMLEDDYEGDEYMFRISKVPLDNANELRAEYREDIRKSDLVTLNVGSNDLFNYAYLCAIEYMRAKGVDFNNMLSSSSASSSDAGVFAAILKVAETAGLAAEVVAVVLKALNDGYETFTENWESIVKDIYDLNPDVKLVVVGLMNPMKNTKLTDNSLIEIGRVADLQVLRGNLYMQIQSGYADTYTYVDVTDTELCDMPAITNKNFFYWMTTCVHPTIAGHRYMAEQILKALGCEDRLIGERLMYSDVTQNDWFYEAVKYNNEHGYMMGTGDGVFSPSETLSRAMVVQSLYAKEAKPSAESAGFSDVPETAWYADAVNWAAAKGIAAGYEEGYFAPEQNITRQQLAVILYGYARYKGENLTAASSLDGYTDASQISSYALPAMQWAVASGLISGRSETELAPAGTITRAETAQMLMNFDKNL